MKLDIKQRKILFAFALPCVHEIELCRMQKAPTQRLWGFMEMHDFGRQAILCDPPKGLLSKCGVAGWRLWQTLWLLRLSRKASGIVAVHEIAALYLLFIRFLRLHRSPLVVVNVGLLHSKNERGIRRFLWTLLARRADVIVSLVEAQCRELHRLFGVPISRTRYIPMLVDVGFYERVNPEREERFCLAVGTNDGKDYETLLEALPLGERLVVVTDSFNAAKIRSHRCFGAGVEVYENVPAFDLRELYRRARVLIIPLADVRHGSGHSVLLENMALGKVVIVTASRSMVGYAEDGINCLTVPVGDASTLRGTILRVLDGAEDFQKLRDRARRDARERFGAHSFAQGVLSILEDLDGARGGGVRRGGAPFFGGKQKQREGHASVS